MIEAKNLPPKLGRRNWWERNWKWFVPVLCLGCVVVLGGFLALIGGVVFASIKASDAYKISLATARADQRVLDAIGSPIKEGLFVTGSIRVSGDSGQADLAIPVSGPKGKGTIYSVASKAAGQWTFSTLVFQAKGSAERIDLGEKGPITRGM